MRLRQGGRDYEAELLELRQTVMYNGMDTIRLRIAPGGYLNSRVTALLEDETGKVPVVILEHHPDTGLVIVWARSTPAK